MVKLLKSIGNEFIYGGHLIALGAVGIGLTLIILIEKQVLLSPLIIIYFLSFVSILHNRYKEKEIDWLTNPERTKFLEKYFQNIPLVILLISAIILSILVAENALAPLIFLIVLAIIILLYTKYLKHLTSEFCALKNIVFSLIVSLLLVFISIYYSYNFFNPLFILIFTFCFLRMLVNTIFLDIKDMESDQKNKLKTLPIVFGPSKTIFLLKILTLISGILLITGVIIKLIPRYSLILLFVIPYSFYYFKKSEKAKYFNLVNYVLADAEFVLWPTSIIIVKNFLI